MTLRVATGCTTCLPAARIGIAIALVLTWPTLLLAQQGAVPADTALAFEVVSIKPTRLERRTTQLTPSSLRMASASLRELIAFSYTIPTARVVGGEKWIGDERFEVRASLPKIDETPRQQLPSILKAMMRSLLAERFDLKVREDTRMLPAFVLRVKDPGRTDVPGLRPSDPVCEEMRLAALKVEPSRPPPVRSPADLPPPRYCNLGARVRDDTVTLYGGDVSMEELRVNLEIYLGRPVQDETGIQGHFGLEFTVGKSQIPMYGGLSAAPGRLLDGGPSISAALADELNIALHSEERPVPVIVVEHAQRLTPN